MSQVEIKALNKLPVQRCALNFYLIVSGNNISQPLIEVINKHKMLPVFADGGSVFM